MLSVTPLALSLDPTEVTPAALLAVSNHYYTVLEAFDELRHAYTLARQHNGQLHAAPTAMREVADRFVTFVQRKYNASQAKLDDANFRAADAIASVLRIEHELLRETSTEAYDRLQHYAAQLERRIEGRLMDGELDRSVLQIARDLSEVRRENADLARHAADHHNPIRSAQAAQASTVADLAESRSQCDALKSRLGDLLTHAQRVEESNQQLREDLRTISGGDSAVHGLHLEIHVRGERIRELEGLLDRISAHRDRLQQDFDDANRRAERANGAVERANAAADRQQAAVQESHRQNAATLERVHDVEGQLDQLRRERDQHAREYQTVATNFRRSQERLTQANARIDTFAHLRSERDALREELRVSIAAPNSLQAEKQVLQGELRASREALTPARPPASTPPPATTSSAPDPADPAHASCVRGCRELLVQIADIQQAYGHLAATSTAWRWTSALWKPNMDHTSALERIAQVAALAVLVPPRVAGVQVPSVPSPTACVPSSSKRARLPAIEPGLVAAPAAKRVRPVDPAGDEVDDDYACSNTGTEPNTLTPTTQARFRSDFRRRDSKSLARSGVSSASEGSAAAPIVVENADAVELSGGIDEDTSTVDLDDSSTGVSLSAALRGEGPGTGGQLTVGSATTDGAAHAGVVATCGFYRGGRPLGAVSDRRVNHDTATPRVVIDYQVLSVGWMFPERVGRGGTLDRALYTPELISRVNVEGLYAEEPRQALSTRPAPHTFDLDVSPQLLSIVDGYMDFESDCLQAIWESTHPFPIPKALKRSDPWFASFYTSRKNRSSHVREKYRDRQEQGFEKARRTGCCDLDLWLDPMFARFPQQSEDTTWFTGGEAIAAGRAAPADLVDALADCDRADPWRNHFRTSAGSHPALRIDRLRLKFSRA
ncbi:hypothetical protein PHYSODRAFT_301055 [Phytophthora sojae]|uniref:Uncharacterized protein n=1 Tax=Phytophthora sojae (strain P6497) TaxID=1094619 RepID=G4ZDL7_PHYSP|nr:hypothetical protein PHYSODRAFT_301055 [Phytophthora sojae]EGZ18356.1 hypothetical protein PHYSODRAFT_301055 [Phytophthora sojae]|eukprot:XP_009527414.1 hypothetical protein PHYSODRAFT_301055 [Phytophthora sojae]